MQDTFAVRLLRLQSQRGIDKRQLMEMTGLSEYAIRKFQTCESNPNMRSLVALAKALNVSLDYLCGLKDQP